MCNKHVHADLMLQYAQDAQETACPWERWETLVHPNVRWIDLVGMPLWHVTSQYRRKRKTHIVNGKEVAAPLDKVCEGDTVWKMKLTSPPWVYPYSVSNTSLCVEEIEFGLLFKTARDAQENFDAHFPPRNLKA